MAAVAAFRGVKRSARVAGVSRHWGRDWLAGIQPAARRLILAPGLWCCPPRPRSLAATMVRHGSTYDDRNYHLVPSVVVTRRSCMRVLARLCAPLAASAALFLKREPTGQQFMSSHVRERLWSQNNWNTREIRCDTAVEAADGGPATTRDLRAAAHALGLNLHILSASTEAEIWRLCRPYLKGEKPRRTPGYYIALTKAARARFDSSEVATAAFASLLSGAVAVLPRQARAYQ